MQYVHPKYMTYAFYQILWKFYLHGDCVNFGKKMVEFILIVYGKNMNKNHGAKKLAMSKGESPEKFCTLGRKNEIR